MFDVEALSRDLMRALRGASAQPAFSRSLGFRSNAAYLWEHGRRYPEVSAFLKAALARDAELGRTLARFFDQPAETYQGRRAISLRTVTRLVVQLSGQRSESWLFPLDLSDPEAPVLQGAVRAGAQLSGADEQGLDLEPQLLGDGGPDGRVWGYAVDEPVYGADGNAVYDAAGHGIHRCSPASTARTASRSGSSARASRATWPASTRAWSWARTRSMLVAWATGSPC